MNVFKNFFFQTMSNKIDVAERHCYSCYSKVPTWLMQLYSDNHIHTNDVIWSYLWKRDEM